MRLFDDAGTLIYDFFIDYAEAGPDDKGRSVTAITHLGVDGPDGKFTVGPNPADVISNSSLFWNGGHNPALDLVNSPERVLTNTYDADTTADPNNIWIYELVYEWSVPKAAFAAGGGYGSVQILQVHNSPFKTGNPQPIPLVTISKTAEKPSGSEVAAGETITYTIYRDQLGHDRPDQRRHHRRGRQ
ncbi:MAG: hypothetical protein IIA44_01185 [Acidobacteria bacterium]|nr:hypothetical protein [Acidobacteriota bacterium]